MAMLYISFYIMIIYIINEIFIILSDLDLIVPTKFNDNPLNQNI